MTIQGKNRTLPPFRAELVGSFLRPEAIKTARQAFTQGLISKNELRDIENREILKLVAKQKEVGLSFITDGEYRRAYWHLDFLEGLDGVTKTETKYDLQFHEVKIKNECVYISGEVDFTNHPMLEDFTFLYELSNDHISKFTIPSPNVLYHLGAKVSELYKEKPVYKSDEELRRAIANTYKKAIKAFYDRGCRYLQFDDTIWGRFCDIKFQQDCKEKAIDTEQLYREYVELINESISEKPDDLFIGLHVCRGNFQSSWFSSGGYEPVAKVLFGEAKVDAFFLEYDNDRSGDFAPLRYIKDQFVVLGLITTKFAELEDKEAVIKRIEEASQYVNIDQLCLSPQCGFSSTEEGNKITEEDQWNKVKLVLDIANSVWK